MSRTDDLRRDGAKERGGGGGSGRPFVRWPNEEDYAWVEGTVQEVWAGKYGDTAVLKVSNHSPGLMAGGKTEEGEKFTTAVKPQMNLNVGLNYAALKGSIADSDKGVHVHVAFEGWEYNKAGDRYRVFRVLELPKQQRAEAPAAVGGGPGAPGQEAPPADEYEDYGDDGGPEDDLPF